MSWLLPYTLFVRLECRIRNGHLIRMSDIVKKFEQRRLLSHWIIGSDQWIHIWYEKWIIASKMSVSKQRNLQFHHRTNDENDFCKTMWTSAAGVMQRVTNLRKFLISGAKFKNGVKSDVRWGVRCAAVPQRERFGDRTVTRTRECGMSREWRVEGGRRESVEIRESLERWRGCLFPLWEWEVFV